MASRIMDTLERLLPRKGSEAVSETDTVRKLQADLEYFEDFIKDPQVPDFAEMIERVILVQSGLILNPQLSVMRRGNTYDTVAVTEDGRERGPIIFVGYMPPGSAIGVRSGVYEENHLSGPSVHINCVGHNRTNRQELTQKGVGISMYNIPVDVAQLVLGAFTKVEAEDRNEVLLRLAASEDVTGCYAQNHWVEALRREIEREGQPKPGIDEDSVYVIRGQGEKVAIFGNAQGVHQDSSYINLDIRIERPGFAFKTPRHE